MAKKYEVWVGGRLIGKRSASTDRDYTHAVIGRTVTKWDSPDPYEAVRDLPIEERAKVTEADYMRWRNTRKAAEYGELAAFSFAGSLKLGQDRLREFMGENNKDLAVVPVTVVEKWTKVDANGFKVLTLTEAAEEFLDFFADFIGGSNWQELNGETGEIKPPALAQFQAAIEREKAKQKAITNRARPIDNHVSEMQRRREADRVDGYDRDDLGDSPDY